MLIDLPGRTNLPALIEFLRSQGLRLSYAPDGRGVWTCEPIPPPKEDKPCTPIPA